MRPAYGMGRRSFSRPGALRFTAAPCSRLAKRRAVQQGGRPAIHSGAAPLTAIPGGRRRSPRSTRQAADSPTARRKPASQQPPTTGHEMADKPARQPPAGPPSPAPSCINPPGHQRAPPSPSGKSAYQFPRLAPPSPLWETRTTPPARAAEHARPLHPFCGGSTRRAPLRRGKRGCGGAENILFLIPEYPLTTA